MSYSKPCKTKPCGCADTGLTTPNPCVHDSPECPFPNPCAESFSDCCAIHDGPTIVDTGIMQGDSLCNILQIMSLWATNPTCMQQGGTCRSPLALAPSTITPASIKVGWTCPIVPLNFQVEYKLTTVLSWTVNPMVSGTTLTDTIGGLTPNTYYHIRVSALCGTSSCYSVTLIVQTKP